MRRRWFSAILILTVVGIGTGAAVLIPAAASRPGRAVCQPSIDSLSASATSSTTAVVAASFTSGSSSGGSWEMDISSPQTTKVVSEFDGPGGSINESLAGLIPNTHYRGTLTVRSDCGSSMHSSTSGHPTRRVALSLRPSTLSRSARSPPTPRSWVTASRRAVTRTPPSRSRRAGSTAPSRSPLRRRRPGPAGRTRPGTAYTVTLTVTNSCGQTRGRQRSRPLA